MKHICKLAGKEKCFACYACVNACARGCISMVKDECGSLYPRVDGASCIGCGRCEAVCPVFHDAPRAEPRRVYAAYSRDAETVKGCASGGVATEITRWTLARGGVVWGAAMVDGEVCHIRVDSEAGAASIRGSKYVHSHMKEAHARIRRDLEAGLLVTVIATPCQIAGVIRYLGGRTEGLLTVDILCHGVPSLDCFLNGLALETERPVSSVTFRDGSSYCLTGFDGDGEVFRTPYRASYWLNGFVEGYLFRENCYSCPYAGKERCGDVTLGDFWGLDNGFDVQSGVNLAAVNTDAGESLWQEIRDRLIFEERTLAEAILYNHPLCRPAQKPKRYAEFQRLYRARGGQAAILGAYRNKTLYIRLRRALRKHPHLHRSLTALPLIGPKLK